MFRKLVTLLIVAVPRAAFACPVCFGQSDSPLANATNLGIMAMLVVVVAVLSGFAAFIVRLSRRERLLSGGAVVQHVEPSRFASTNPEEGTAQC